jgi:hypothetical protein
VDEIEGDYMERRSHLRFVSRELHRFSEELAALEQSMAATSPVSSAPTTGPVPKQSESSTGTPVALTENQAAILTPLVEAITVCIKSTPSINGAWDLTWDGSSILLRISPLPTTSGETPAGDPGPVSPTEIRWPQFNGYYLTPMGNSRRAR